MRDLYLSRIRLDPRQRPVRRDLADCVQLHRTIMSAFPRAENPARAALHVLFRAEVPRVGAVPHLLVQSSIAPDWSRLPSGYEVPEAPKNVADAYVRASAVGRRLRFRLRANATRKIGTKTVDGVRSNGTRVPLRQVDELAQWLARQADQHGFRLASGVPTVQVRPGHVVRGHRTGQIITVEAAMFDGLIEVADAGRFLAALESGIGPAKSYGCGLLSVAPVGAMEPV